MTDLSWCRRLFPALEREVNGRPAVFLDGPGGTQTPGSVIDAVSWYLREANSNAGGPFVTSRLTDEVVARARAAAGCLLGADAGGIAFGASMTSLCYSLALALGRDLGNGDRVVITDMDHEANRGPWLDLSERGVDVVSAPVNTVACQLDMDALLSLVDERTRVVAVGLASNAVGTVNDLEPVMRAARRVGAVSVVDAVHYAPHLPVDVKQLDCDFLLCSAYKFFGPHLGVLYGRRDAFELLRAYRIAPQKPCPPNKIEAGTLNHEGLAGLEAAVSFIAGLGTGQGSAQISREAAVAGMEAVGRYEDALAVRLLDGLEDMEQVRVYGPRRGRPRTPTVSFAVAGMTAREVSSYLGDRGIFTWDGHFYAMTLVSRLGLDDAGGLVRVGFAPYNTAEEVDLLLQELSELCR